MSTIERLATLLNRISDQSINHNCMNYLDSLNNLKQQPDFFSSIEPNFISRILIWEINIREKNYSDYPLYPVLCPGYEYYTFEMLLKICFNENEINMFIELENLNILTSNELRARINDILWCYKHQKKELQKQRLIFAKNAIKCYISAANQQSEREPLVDRLVRATDIARSIRHALVKGDDLVSSLHQAILENLDPNDSTDNTYMLLKARLELDPQYKEESLKLLHAILEKNYPQPRMNSDSLNNYYDLFIKQCGDESLKTTYREKKIESLLWFCEHAENEDHPKLALDFANQAEKELAKLRTSSKKIEFKYKIEEKKIQCNKLPDGMKWHRCTIEILRKNIIDPQTLSRVKTMTLVEIFQTLLNDFHHINYKKIRETLDSLPFIKTSTLLTSNDTDLLTHDEKPKAINYSDDELMKIHFLNKANRTIIANKIYHLFTAQRENIPNNFSQIEKYLQQIGLEKRQVIILNSIKYAISGDICTTLHLIIPQVENFLRLVVQKAGIDTTSLTSENNSEELSMSQLFDKANTSKVIIDKYGHDTFCELYLLLLDKRCTNYRHNISHGRMDDNKFNEEEVFYVLGLCLYVIFKDLLFAENRQTVTSDESISTEV